MSKYQSGKIYEITSESSKKRYVGSTTQKYLSSRLAEHKQDYKRYLNGKYAFVSSFDVIKEEDHIITLIESYPCNSRDELVARERYWIEKKECVNKKLPIMTIEEKKEVKAKYDKNYLEKNSVKIALRKKVWLEKSKDRVKQYRQQTELCACGMKYTLWNKARHMKTKTHLNIVQDPDFIPHYSLF